MKNASLQGGAIVASRYIVQRFIGGGAMSEVYVVQDLRLQGKLWALKRNDRARFPQGAHSLEAELLMQLQHPQLPLIVDYIPPNEEQVEYLIMDFIEGESLAKVMAQHQNGLKLSLVLSITQQLLAALDYLHRRQPSIIHCDLKPGNVMIDHLGNVRLIDFGIAETGELSITHHAMGMGTPGFAAPEQYRREPCDERTDLYSLGALLYCMLSGQRFVSHWMNAIKHLPDGLPPRLLTLLEQLLNPSRERRPASVDVVRQQIHTLSQSFNESLAPLSFAVRTSSKIEVAVVALAPHSGATFITMALAHLWARSSGDRCAAVEYCTPYPAWHTLLAPASGKSASSHDIRYETVRHLGVSWYMLHEHYTRPAHVDEQTHHRALLAALREQVVFIDMSSPWDDQHRVAQLEQADVCLIVGDPYVGRWSASTVRRARQVANHRRQAKRPTYFVANQDVPFPQRKEWLAHFSQLPQVYVPHFATETVVKAHWKRQLLSETPAVTTVLENVFAPLLQTIQARMPYV